MHMKKTRFFFFITLAVVLGLIVRSQIYKHSAPLSQVSETASAKETQTIVRIDIQTGNTFTALLGEYGVPVENAQAILDAAKPVYDFANIRAGKTIKLALDSATNALQTLTYEPNTETAIIVQASEAGWIAMEQPISYEVRRATVRGTIESSLYETALAQGLDERAVIALAEMFAWHIDFAVDIRVGDTFSMVYEERYRDGEYVMPGSILAAKFVNGGATFNGYEYTQSDGAAGYFDEQGNSLQKIFLKSPLQYRYISSGFTNARYHPILKVYTAHHGIDYAAPQGTPAVSVGDGTVVHAGWLGGYGYAVDVRHNETYTTRYGHFSKIAVKVGQKISQGQVVGYVGSTGWSTGPHLHFEMIKRGSKVDPFKEEVPTSEPLAADLLPAFQEHIKQFEL